MMKALFAAAGLLALSGCTIFQDVYDEEARQQCNDLPTPDERLACSRAADDAERARRQSD